MIGRVRGGGGRNRLHCGTSTPRASSKLLLSAPFWRSQHVPLWARDIVQVLNPATGTEASAKGLVRTRLHRAGQCRNTWEPPPLAVEKRVSNSLGLLGREVFLAADKLQETGVRTERGRSGRAAFLSRPGIAFRLALAAMTKPDRGWEIMLELELIRSRQSNVAAAHHA